MQRKQDGQLLTEDEIQLYHPKAITWFSAEQLENARAHFPTTCPNCGLIDYGVGFKPCKCATQSAF